MNLEAVKVLIANYIQDNSSSDELINPNQSEKSGYDSVFQEKIVQGIINKCDTDSNGELDENEIHKLSLKLSSYEEFLDVSFEGFLDSVDSDVDWEEYEQETDLTDDELNLQNYEEKADFANFVLSSDDKVAQEQFTQSVDLDLQIDENLAQINLLLEDKENLSDEQKTELAELMATRKQLLTQRSEFENSILAESGEQTMLAMQEMQSARQLLGNNQLESLEALEALQQELNLPVVDDSSEIPETDTIEQTETTPTVSNPTSTSSRTGGGGSTYIPAKSSAEAAQEKAKTKEELQQELTTTEAQLSEKQNLLKGVTDGSGQEVAADKALMDSAYENYQTILNEVAPELATQLDTAKVALDEAQKAYDENQLNIVNYSVSLMTMESDKTGLESDIAACDSALASLNSTDTSQFTSEQLSDYNQRKTTLTNKRAEAERQKATLQAQIDSTNSLLNDANAADVNLAQAVTNAQSEYDNIDLQIQQLDNETLNAAKTEYDTAKQNFETKQLSLIETYTTDIATATAKVQELKAQITELEKQEIESQGKMGINGNPVEFNGQTYDSVVPAEKINELLSLISKTNATTRDGHNDMCLAFSVWYGQYLNGKASASEFNQFLKAGNISYGNGRSSMDDYDNTDKNTVLSKVATEINSGRPAILQVGASNNTSRHYVLVVGLREGASNPPKEDDLLIVDTYDGVLEGMGQYGSRDMITGAQCRKKYSGYQMYTLTA